MAIWLTKNSVVIVQGMTGSEGRKHTKRMIDAGTTVIGGVTPGKAGEQVTFGQTTVPVFDTVQRAVEVLDADTSVVFVPPRFAKAAVVEAVAKCHTNHWGCA